MTMVRDKKMEIQSCGHYELAVRETFSAAHQLRGYNGGCESLHGHNWLVEVRVRVYALDEIGLGIDFKEIKDVLRSVLARLDHRNLNELQEFAAKNPSSENIARWLFEQLTPKLNSATAKLVGVTVCESENQRASFCSG